LRQTGLPTVVHMDVLDANKLHLGWLRILEGEYRKGLAQIHISTSTGIPIAASMGVYRSTWVRARRLTTSAYGAKGGTSPVVQRASERPRMRDALCVLLQARDHADGDAVLLPRRGVLLALPSDGTLILRDFWAGHFPGIAVDSARLHSGVGQWGATLRAAPTATRRSGRLLWSRAWDCNRIIGRHGGCCRRSGGRFVSKASASRASL
jgi:hypothetical protein